MRKNPFLFACMACDIAGFKLPESGLPDSQTDGFLMRFEAIKDVDVSLAYETETCEFLISANFGPPKRRSLEEVCAMALKMNYLRREAEPCFAMDPVSMGLAMSRSISARGLDLADLAVAMTEVTAFAVQWRATMDEAANQPLPTSSNTVIRI